MTKKVVLTRATRRGGTPAGSSTSSQPSGPGTNVAPPSPPLREGGGGALSSQSTLQKNETKQQDLNGLVDSLSADQRKALLDLLALDSYKPSKLEKDDQRDLDMWAGAIYESLVATIGTSGTSVGGPLVIKRLLGTQSCWSQVKGFMLASKLAELDVPSRQSAYRLLAGMLVAHARSIARHVGAPLTPKLVANNCAALPGVFEDAFPGYVAAGLARVVITRAMAA